MALTKYYIYTHEPVFTVRDAKGNKIKQRPDGYVELSEEQVSELVDAIRDSGTTDVDEMKLSSRLPQIYNKLDNACRDIAIYDEENYILMQGALNGTFEYDAEALMKYCEKEYSFSDGDDPEDFAAWLEYCLDSMEGPELLDFVINHMNGTVDVDSASFDYKVLIPRDIISQSNIDIC